MTKGVISKDQRSNQMKIKQATANMATKAVICQKQ